MSLTVVGSVAFDALGTPFGKRDRVLGGIGKTRTPIDSAIAAVLTGC